MLVEAREKLFARLRGQLVVSVQAYPGEAMCDPNVIARVTGW